MAYLSGGMAGAGLQKDINKFNIFIVRTSFPDIKNSKHLTVLKVIQ